MMTISKWEMISESKLHFSASAGNGRTVCIDGSSNQPIVSYECKCLGKDSSCQPGDKWFNVITRIRDRLIM